MITVSVIIPFYNRTTWTAEAISSVLSQTFQDFEIILIDDGSSEKISEYINTRRPKIRYIKQDNRGPASARNRGVGEARGKYIAFLDSDDLFHPRKLEKQVGVMNANPNVLLSHTSYRLIDEKGNKIKDINSGNFSGMVYPQIFFHCLIATPTVMIRKDALHKDEKFNESLRIGEDIILWSKIAKKSNIIGMKEVLTSVRMHGDNAAIDVDLQMEGIRNIYDYAISHNFARNPLLVLRLLSSKNRVLGYWYTKKGEKWKGFRRYVTSALMNPLQPDLVFHFGSIIFPKWIKNTNKPILGSRNRYNETAQDL